MWANKKNNNFGFTVVETLIVLAVSSAIFFSVSAMIQGQVSKNKSRDSAYRLQSTVQSVINDVGNGFYPTDGYKYDCTGARGAAGDNRGTNTNCVLAGKRITFQQNDIKVETLIVPATTVALGNSPAIFTTVAPLTETKQYPWSGKRIGATDKVYYILNSVFAPNMNGNTFVAGSQKVIFYAANTAVSNFNIPSAANNFVCVDNNKYHSKLTFPTNGTINVDLAIDDKVACP
jgi:type II secretory pathway pseudopilin PulG